MPEDKEVVYTQLATRIPKVLHRKVKMQCVGDGTPVMEFVIEALEMHLRRKAKAK